MSSETWITSFSCSHPSNPTLTHTFLSNLLQWLRFFFLSPCPQRALFSALDVLLLFILFVFAVKKLYFKFASINGGSTTASELHKPLVTKTTSFTGTTVRFKLTITATVVKAILYSVACILVFKEASQPPNLTLFDALFWLLQAVTNVVLVVLIIHEKRFQTVYHPTSLRVYWISEFILISLFTASGVIRFVEAKGVNFLQVDDTVSFISFPLSLLLLFVGIQGFTGIRTTTQESEETEPLVNGKTNNITLFSSASVASKAFWLWVNPLLCKGYESPLKIDDVPFLSPQQSAEAMAALFESKWPKPKGTSKHPVRLTLLRCFWKELTLAALLAFIRLCVMFVGPILIQSFVDYTAGKRSSVYEGYYLVSILFLAKFIEVLTSHHFTFKCQILGTLIRSTLITSLYKKGLTLSCSARQDHGVGTIVNYMAVDAQQLSDMIRQLNAVWVVPLQVGIGLFLLYKSLGASVVTAFLVLLALLGFVVVTTRTNNHSQFNMMTNRDSRMKAVNEMLNYMRVIKFQAWEEHFRGRILGFRDSEFEWLSKFMYCISANFVVMWSTTLIISTITFGTAIFLGVPLDAGTVFTTTSIFKILEEPVRAFPQSMVSLSQAIVSLGRLDRYMLSSELSDDSVERDGTYAVEVKSGIFSWNDDDETGRDLKNINLEIKKGELTAIVGTVGSGKSSLLASILGEMRKISGVVRVCGSTGYVAQTSWIQNGTIEENILFGLPMERPKYEEVLRVCCLEKDLEMMEYGDQTEIGERGINLSGGQKQRIQLARAVYQDSDIYLLDDVFSAVDAHTGSQIFKVVFLSFFAHIPIYILYSSCHQLRRKLLRICCFVVSGMCTGSSKRQDCYPCNAPSGLLA